MEAARAQLCAYLRERAPAANVSELFSPCATALIEPLLPRPTRAVSANATRSDASWDPSRDASRSGADGGDGLVSGTGVGAASTASARRSRHARLMAEVAKLKARDEAKAKARDEIRTKARFEREVRAAERRRLEEEEILRRSERRAERRKVLPLDDLELD